MGQHTNQAPHRTAQVTSSAATQNARAYSRNEKVPTAIVIGRRPLRPNLRTPPRCSRYARDPARTAPPPRRCRRCPRSWRPSAGLRRRILRNPQPHRERLVKELRPGRPRFVTPTPTAPGCTCRRRPPYPQHRHHGYPRQRQRQVADPPSSVRTVCAAPGG